MFDAKTLNKAIEQLASEKDIDAEQVREAVEAALASAYKKEFDRKGEIIRSKLDTKSGGVRFYQVKTVVDETMVRLPEEGEDESADENQGGEAKKPDSTDSKKEEKSTGTEDDGEEKLPLYNESRHIFLDEAKKIKKDVALEDELEFDLPDPPEEFGRIAAQTAKQVILQRMREIEKNIIKGEFEDMVGELVTGMVQRIEKGNVFVDLGKASGIMFYSEAIPGEHYRVGERLRFYLLGVQDAGRAPMLSLSRTHPKFISKLFELEVPEIADDIIEIKGVVREPGHRTKIAVGTEVEGVDPVGACVGQRGARVMAVNNELFNERIDIIEWSEDVSEYIAASLSPAQVSSVELTDEQNALVLVPEDQLSLAIGKGGQNVRLAARLTGWRIDVRSQSKPDEVQEGGFAATEAVAGKDDVKGTEPELEMSEKEEKIEEAREEGGEEKEQEEEKETPDKKTSTEEENEVSEEQEDSSSPNKDTENKPSDEDHSK